MLSSEEQKEIAAKKAVEYVREGMIVGLGTGSTADFVVKELGKKSLDIKGVPTSIDTQALAESLSIELLDVNEVEVIDLTIDGADQINPRTGVCIKGGGGAHYMEKRVALKSDRLIIIVDESKLVSDFSGYKVPLEVDPVDMEEVEDYLIDFELSFRDFESDSGNLIADVVFDGSMSFKEFDEFLQDTPGVLDTGIFNGLVSKLIVGRKDGSVEEFEFK